MATYFICGYILLVFYHLGTIAAPSVRRPLATGDRTRDMHEPSSTVLVAGGDLDDGDGDLDDSDGDLDDGDLGGHHDDEDTDEDCHLHMTRKIEDCLEGFEVQLMQYEGDDLPEDEKWSEMKELCQEHDRTLLCIHNAFVFCTPTSVDLDLISYRIGHIRDSMLRKCRVARERTTTTTVAPSTSTTTVAPAAGKALLDFGDYWNLDEAETETVPNNIKFRDNLRHGDDNRDDGLSEPSGGDGSHRGPPYSTGDYNTNTPPSGKNMKQNANKSDNEKLENEQNNDTLSRLRINEAEDGDGAAIWCETSEGGKNTECILRILGNSAAALSGSALKVIVVCLLTMTFAVR